MVTATLPDLNTLTLDALKALIVAQHERLLTREREVEHLKLLIARLQRMQFGRKSEKLAQQIEQLELRLEELQSEPVEDSSPEAEPSVLINKDTASAKPARHPLPEHLPRQTRRHEPKESACPDCGGVLRKLGEDVSEMLEYVPASFFVIRHVRPKLSCSHCERIVQAAAPSRPNRAWHGWTGTLGACADIEICGPLAFVSSVGDLCARGRGTGALDSCRLGGQHESVADASGRCPETLCDSGEQAAR